ncbi:hypothetical protein GGI26_005774 [Coemansia sp. RSA 1358]|uniref:Uncharacterized protein n=1 Tax=Coemansia umbellata TaxID=1424467 RepID=A0ABQ8PFC5_9FUNG|nr:hypothetical protein EDC05_005521 [Coemansia umbellata]KAJ2619502.1 hypothetical protein GGI26_005774 [Coemansia sp. RSA 1358]
MLDRLKTLVDKLTNIVPNIEVLHLDALEPSSLISDFASLIAERYTSQLNQLGSIIPLSIETPHCMDRIREFSLYFEPGCKAVVPQISVDVLTRLELIYIPSSFLWSTFYSNQGNLSECFSNLKYLYIYFDANSHAFPHYLPNNWDKQKAQLSETRFPKLEVLKLNMCNAGCALLKNAYIPKQLKVLYIYIAEDVYVTFVDVAFDRKARLKICDSIESNINSHVIFHVATSLLNGCQIAKYTAFTTQGHIGFPNNIQARWKNVNNVTIDIPVTPTLALSIIEMLPLATELYFTRLRTDNIGDDNIADELWAKQWSGLEPFDSKLRTLKLLCVFGPKALTALYFTYISIQLLELTELIIIEKYHAVFRKADESDEKIAKGFGSGVSVIGVARSAKTLLRLAQTLSQPNTKFIACAADITNGVDVSRICD